MFPKVFVINLKRSVERRAHMQKLLQHLSLDYEFIEAIDFRDLTHADIEAVYDDRSCQKTMKRSLSNAEIACALSHRKAWIRIKSLGLEEAFIMEDDVIVKDENAFLEILNQRSKFPQDCELMLFSHGSSRRLGQGAATSLFHKKRIYGKYKTVRFVQRVWSVCGIWCNRVAIEKLLEATQVLKATLDDGYTGNDRVVNLYGISPVLVEEHPLLGKDSTLLEQRKREIDKVKKSFFVKFFFRLGLLPPLRWIKTKLYRWGSIFFKSFYVRKYYELP